MSTIKRQELVNFDRSHAIIIGINEYPDIGKPLTTPVRDARELARVLVDFQGFDPRYVHQLVDNPNKADIEALINTFKAVEQRDNNASEEASIFEITPKDCLVFYFAGHGLAGDIDGKGPAGYFLPNNTSFQQATLSENDTLLSMDWVFQQLEALNAHHTLLILDCCFAGAFKRVSTKRNSLAVGFGPMSEIRFERYKKKRAWQVLASAGPAEKAADLISDRGEIIKRLGKEGQRNHSPFAIALLDALRGTSAIDVKPRGKNLGDGVLTCHELFIYLHNEVERLTREDEHFEPQNPTLITMPRDMGGQFIFCDRKHPKSKPDWDKRKRINPYKGLKQMDIGDAPYYYGRESDLAVLKKMLALPLDISQPAEYQLLTKLKNTEKKDHRFEIIPSAVLVTGASGSGKSSLVKAGLLPQMLAEGYTLFQLRPGDKPWKLELCHRYNWHWDLVKRNAPLSLTFPKNKGVDAQDIEINKQDSKQQIDQVFNHFYTELQHCHALEEEVLKKSLANQLSKKENGCWEIHLQLDPVWKEAYQNLPTDFNIADNNGNWARHMQSNNRWKDYQKAINDAVHAAKNKALEANGFVSDEDIDLALDDVKQQFEQDSPLTAFPIFSNEKNPKQVLYIDQYEEVFTECTTVEREILEWQILELFERAAHTVEQARMIISMRSDFEWQLEISRLGQAYFNNSSSTENKYQLYRLFELGLDDLRNALTKPALVAAYEFQKDEHTDLTDIILEELDYMPNALPLLSYTMQEMVVETDKQERVFKKDTYTNKIKGVTGVLGRKIQSLYNQLNTQQEKNIMRNILLRMVQLSDGEYARRRVLRFPDKDEFYFSENNETTEAIIKLLYDASLISKGGEQVDSSNNKIPYVELIHDSLINTWTKGKEWINEMGKDTLLLQRQLWQAVIDQEKFQSEANTLQTKQRPLEAVEMDHASSSSLWDNNPKLMQLMAALLQYQKDKQGNLVSPLKDFDTAPLSAEEQEIVHDLKLELEVRDGLLNPILQIATLSKLTVGIVHQLFVQTDHWLNIPEMQFIIDSWQARTDRIRKLEEDRDNALQLAKEATAAFLAARGQGLEDKDPTTGINLAYASNALMYNMEAVMAIKSLNAAGPFFKQSLLPPDVGLIHHLAFSPVDNNKLLAVSSGSTQLWDIPSGKIDRQIKRSPDSTIAGSFSPDGKRIATSCMGAEPIANVQIWPINSDRASTVFDIETDIMLPDDRQRKFEKLEINMTSTWELDINEGLQKFIGFREGYIFSTLLPDNTSILTVNTFLKVQIRDIDSEDLIAEIHPFKHSHDKVGYPICMALSPKGNFLAISEIKGGRIETGNIWLIDIANKQLLDKKIRMHQRYAQALAFNNDEDLIYAGLNTGEWESFQLSNGKSKQCIQSDEGALFALAYAPHTDELLSAGEEGIIKRWDVRSGKLLEKYIGHYDPVYELAFSADGEQFASGAIEGGIKIWPYENRVGKVRREITPPSFAWTSEKISTISPDGLHLAYSDSMNTPIGTDDELKLMDISKEEVLETVAVRVDEIGHIAFSPDSKFVVSVDVTPQDQISAGSVNIRVVQLSGGEIIHHIKSNFSVRNPIGAIAISKGAEHIIYSDYETGSVVVYFTKTEEKKVFSKVHWKRVTCIEVHPEHPLFLSATDGEIMIWDLTDLLQPVVTLRGGSRSMISCACFDKEGRFIFTAGESHTVLRWDLETEQFDRVYEGHTEAINCIAISDNNQLLVTGSDDGKIGIWDIHYGDLIQLIEFEEASPIAPSLSDLPEDYRKKNRKKTIDEQIASVRFTNNDREVIAVSKTGQVKVWSNQLYQWPEECYVLSNEERRYFRIPEEVDYRGEE
jgi:WD40 repeat protein/energy-coupling factor transporter ATP-binding protein EcfA2